MTDEGRMRLKVEKLAALLTKTEEKKQDIVKWDGEVTGVRIGWGAWALLRAAIIDLIADAKPCTCHPDDNPPVPCAKQYALSECRSIADKEQK